MGSILVIVWNSADLPMKYLSYIILAVLILLTAVEFLPAFVYVFRHLGMYQWLIYGFAAYFIVRRLGFFHRNEKWLQTISHEASHAVVGMMFFHKIHSFHANEGEGAVCHSGRKFGDIFISLAPYCFPLLTYFFLFLRLFIASRVQEVFDVFIGFTLAFHVCCFWLQTGQYQTDIQKHGTLRSFLFIIFFWLFNSSVLLLSIRKGLFKAIGYMFTEYWETIAGFFKVIFN